MIFFIIILIIVHQVCLAIYKVLASFMLGESRKINTYVARYVPFFETQLGFVT
jgi:hypothetical protein